MRPLRSSRRNPIGATVLGTAPPPAAAKPRRRKYQHHPPPSPWSRCRATAGDKPLLALRATRLGRTPREGSLRRDRVTALHAGSGESEAITLARLIFDFFTIAANSLTPPRRKMSHQRVISHLWKNRKNGSHTVSKTGGHRPEKTIEYPLSGHLHGAKWLISFTGSAGFGFKT